MLNIKQLEGFLVDESLVGVGRRCLEFVNVDNLLFQPKLPLTIDEVKKSEESENSLNPLATGEIIK